MEIFPNSRAQSPACSRAQGAAGELRLQDIPRALLLSLLSVLLGRRHAVHYLALPACDTPRDWWINLPESDPELALDDVLASELPLQIRRLLYLFGTRRNRGMRPISRAMPLLCARIARGPPVPEIPLHTPQSAPNHPRLGTMTHAYCLKYKKSFMSFGPWRGGGPAERINTEDTEDTENHGGHGDEASSVFSSSSLCPLC